MVSKTWRGLEQYWSLTLWRVRMTADFQMISILAWILSQKGSLSAPGLKMQQNPTSLFWYVVMLRALA